MPNQMNNKLAPHEALEIHELLQSSVSGYKKLNASISMVKDQDLKNFMKDSLEAKKTEIEQLQQFISTQGTIS